MGLFDAHFAAIPFFYKVREYNDFESRDLWTYHLNLSKEQLERLLDHLWEVGNIPFNYYYFSQNCSYMLMRLLEVANFDIKLMEHLPRHYVIPGDTIRLVYNQGIVTKIEYDPSLRNRFDEAFHRLNREEQKRLLRAYRKKSLGESDRPSADFLDAMVMMIDYKSPKEVLLGEGEIYEWRQELLLKRSQVEGPFVPYQRDHHHEAPHLGHPPRRLSFGASLVENEAGILIGHRTAYHDYLDPSLGLPDLATIEFFDALIRIEQSKVRIQKFDLVEVMALNPWTRYQKPWSLKAKFGLLEERNECQSCHVAQLSLAGGTTFLANGTWTLYSFLGVETLYSGSLNKNYSIRLAPELGLRWRMSPKSAMSLNLFSLHSLKNNGQNKRQYFRLSSEVRTQITSSMAFGLEVHREYRDDQLMGHLFYYY